MRGWKKVIVAVALAVVSCSAVAPVGVVAGQNPQVLRDDRCMANAIWHEARGESLAGKKAVQEVILNRAMATGKTVCAVIKEPYQFSWFGKKPFLPYNDEMRWMLLEVKEHRPVLINEKYMFFHSGKRPSWTKRMACRIIGGHRFCKEKE